LSFKRASSELSYVCGETEPPLLELCVGELLDRTAAASPDSPALVCRCSGVRLTWAELHNEVERLARALMAIGVAKGHRVGIWATNRTEWVLTQLATAKIGAILVNINIRYRAHELKYALQQSECQTLILIRGFHDCDYVDSFFSIAPQFAGQRSGTREAAQLPHLANVIFIGDHPPSSMLPWHELLANAAQISPEELKQREAGLSCHDAINIQYTSGTTGFPKGATLSHHNVVNNGLLISTTMKLTPRDSICIPVPFYHCFGMVLANMSCLASGAAMVLPSESFDPLETLRTVHDERCTAIYGVPTMFIAELQHPAFHQFDLTSLRTGIMAGSPCPIELMHRVVKEMHCPELTIVYGLTESSPGMTQSRTNDSLQARVTTVGGALPHTEIKIADTKTGAVLPRGNVGEICTRGYLVMKGYYNDPMSTAEAIDADGWLHSGDLGVIGDDGYLRMAGRIKEMIIRGGENIYPREIEEFLHTCAGIADVHVIGVPDAKYGEEVMAWVKLKRGATLTEQDIKTFCKGQIADFKIPRHIRFVDSFPMTGSGKIQKFRMREISAADFTAAKRAPAFVPA